MEGYCEICQEKFREIWGSLGDCAGLNRDERQELATRIIHEIAIPLAGCRVKNAKPVSLKLPLRP